jgi:outer membrane receptor protein involved in Fe transport
LRDNPAQKTSRSPRSRQTPALALTQWCYALPELGKGMKVELFGSISNLFDRDPPVAPGGNGYPTNPVYFDTYGMMWRAGVRVSF